MFRLRNTLWCVAALMLLAGVAAVGQSIYANLTGVVSDSTGAVIPNANVTLKNEASGDVRKTVTNSDGYFSFVSFPTGTYSVQVEASGFERWEQKGLSFTGGEARTLSNITMKVGTAAQTVEVLSAADIVAPVDSGEKAQTLTTRQLQDFSVVGRSAAEFIKILPGFGIAGTGTDNKQSFTGQVIGINGNGDGGSQSAFNNAFSANGTVAGTMDITADGAHVSDPGCNCATPVNPNTDMIQELKVMASNFNAENSKGPIVMNTVSKSGGKDFHGEGYFYARNHVMNANNWINNELGIARPNSDFYFPGGNIGGPVLIPGTDFNKNRDKLFFFTGYEYYYQSLDTGVLTATVPTAGMRAGNYSPGELSKLGNVTASGAPPSQLNAGGLAQFPGGIIPPAQQDPGGQVLMNLFPMPNANPNSNGGYNYVKDIQFNQNMYQWLTRVDYSISDNTKLFVRYNLQNELQQFPVSLWWRQGISVPYPTPIESPNQSQSISASLTHVFNPTLTNEFVFGYTYINFPNNFQDPAKVNRTDLGYPYKGLYKNGVQQIPSMLSWGNSEFANIFNPGGFEAGGSQGLYATKYLPSVSDSITKVAGTHTLKFGFYYEFDINVQPNNGYSNGLLVQAPWAGNGSGNPYADLLLGRTANYEEQNFNNLHNEAYNTAEYFIQDSWKVTRRLTLDLGMRVSHFGQWYDRQGLGFAVWEPSLYSASAPATSYPGLTWHAKDPNIPLSGFPSQLFFFAPRFGMAWDVFGTGNTVLRGGWGRFYYHNSQFTTGLDAPAGVQAYSSPTATTLQAIETTNPGTVALNTNALSPTDNLTPRMDSYSFTLSQRITGASLLEVSYVGNQATNLLNDTNIGTNVNAVPIGGLLNIGQNPNNVNVNNYRPYPQYGDLRADQHNLYSNYNSLQVSWVRQRGKYDINLNYTFSKAMGIVGTNQFNLNDDYGPQPFDRRHVFNAAYSIELPSPVTSNALGKGVINGWQLSGITQLQSGINLSGQGVNGGAAESFNLNTGGATLPNGYGISNLSILGTPDLNLQPILTCNPTSNLSAHQYLNASCFSLPKVPGVNGATVLPEIFGPWFFNSDLSLFKNFQIGESKKLQFRFSAYNFLNHPLWTFRGNSSNLNLAFNSAGVLSNPLFGMATEKEGFRLVQLALKFYF